jgi:hypothetical protein
MMPAVANLPLEAHVEGSVVKRLHLLETSVVTDENEGYLKMS